MEAMRCGKPVLTIRDAEITSVIKHGENGIMVNTGEAEEITEVVIYLALYPVERSRIV